VAQEKQSNRAQKKKTGREAQKKGDPDSDNWRERPRKHYDASFKAKIVAWINKHYKSGVYARCGEHFDLKHSMVGRWHRESGGEAPQRVKAGKVGRPPGVKNKRTAFGAATRAFTDALKELQSERDQALKIVAKIRRVVLSGLTDAEIREIENGAD